MADQLSLTEIATDHADAFDLIARELEAEALDELRFEEQGGAVEFSPLRVVDHAGGRE